MKDKNIKLLFLATSLDVGGAETFLVSLANELASRNFDITIICQEGRLAKTLQPKIKHINFELFPPHRFFHPYKFWSNLFLFLDVAKLSKCLGRKNNFDLIYAHHPWPMEVAAELSKKMNIPYLPVVLADYDNEYSKRLFSGNEKIKGVLVISDEIKQVLMRRFKIAEEKIFEYPNPVDCSIFKGSINPAEAICSSRKPRIVWVSQIHAHKLKSIRAAIDALLYLNKKGLVLSMHFVGHGDSDRVVDSWCSDCNNIIGEKVAFFHGYIPEITAVFAAADIVLAVARTAIEAMAMGKPVIILGPREGKEGGSYGGVVNAENISFLQKANFSGRNCGKETSYLLLADDLEKLLHDQELLNKCAKEGQEYVKRHLDIHANTDKFINFVQCLITNN